MEYIKKKGVGTEAAEEAYKNGYYVEAIQTLHSFLEAQARSYLMLIGCMHFNAKQSDTWDLADTLSFNDTLKVLLILNQITNEQYAEFKRFNSLRNKIVHQLYKEPYAKEYLGVPKQQFDEVFKETIKEAFFFTEKCEEIIEL